MGLYYYWCNIQTRSFHFSTSTGRLHFLAGKLQLCNAITVSPNWTTSHSKNLLKVQRNTKGPTIKCLLTTNKNLIWDVLGATANRMYQLRLQLEKYLAWDCLYQKACIRPLKMQSHNLSMTTGVNPTAKSSLWQKSIRTQNEVGDKTRLQPPKNSVYYK